MYIRLSFLDLYDYSLQKELSMCIWYIKLFPCQISLFTKLIIPANIIFCMSWHVNCGDNPGGIWHIICWMCQKIETPKFNKKKIWIVNISFCNFLVFLTAVFYSLFRNLTIFRANYCLKIPNHLKILTLRKSYFWSEY